MAVFTVPARLGQDYARVIVEIVILAMIAVFLGLRLYAVLGRRPEQNEEPLRSRADSVEPMRPAQPAVPVLGDKLSAQARPREIAPADRPGFAPPAEAGIRAIIAADRKFDVGLFLAGARNAYAMILDAYWKGDRDALRHLCDVGVAAHFIEAIDAREAAGEKLDNRLVRIEDIAIVEASFNAPFARVTVRFVADIAAVTRDAAGGVVAGSLDDAIVARDLWTFVRDFGSADPDWLLDEAEPDEAVVEPATRG